MPFHFLEMPVIEIPIRDSAEVVEVDLDDLAESDPQEIIQLLVDEQAPLALFPRFALAYWERGIVGAFEQVCQKGLGECDQRGKSSDSGSVRVHLAGLLAAHLLMQGEVQKATRLLNDAENVDAADETLWLRKGKKQMLFIISCSYDYSKSGR